ncbi:MAG: OmpA family protein [Crocinitomicaceae bacterium TMED209]|nr:MAG: OmpA family protein [Crocinitomicaceae bacterium TMED209]
MSTHPHQNACTRLRSWLTVGFAVCSWTVLFGQIDEDLGIRSYRAQQLIMANIGHYLDGAVEVDVEAGTVSWNASSRQVERNIRSIIEQVASYQYMDGALKDVALSTETTALIERVSNLSFRDLRHWRMAEGLSEAEQWYVMVQSALDEVRMQIGMDLKVQLNQTLMDALQGSVSLDGSNAEWLEIDEGQTLPAMDWERSDATSNDLSGNDASVWPTPAANDAEMAVILERILQLIENQETRLRQLEAGGSPSIAMPSSVPELASGALRLPEYIDVSFYTGSANLTLGAQLQLNEIIEVMGRRPQVRVVCTGHADLPGDRQSNLALSRRRAEAVRAYLLQSGIEPARALLNFFGEERASTTGPSDRRVEVRFYLN